MSRIVGAAAVAFMLAFVVGCGTTNPVSAGSSSPTSPSAVIAPVKTMTVTVGGKSETVLTNDSGYTLYYFTKDTPTTTACTTAVCTGLWHAVMTSASKLQSPSGLGPFTVVQDSLGSQVAYKGHLLYTYAGDKAPGQANGQGVKGLWWVVTPGVSPLTAGAASSSSSGGAY